MASQTTGSFLAAGQALARQGHYESALTQFNKAADAGEADNIRLLNSRSLLYEKLNRRDSALKDVRKVIKLSSGDPGGYIRAGKLLVLMKKHQNAQVLLKRGLLNVPSNHPKRQRLLNFVTPKPSPVDPFTKLPTEIACIVLQYLDFRTIVLSLRVCKEWKNLISSLPQLWETIDFSLAKRPVQTSQARVCIRRAPKCRKVVLKRVVDPNRLLLCQVLLQCHSLENIETDLGLCHYSPVPVHQKLKVLILSGSDPSPVRHIELAISGMPSLERAEFHSVIPDRYFLWRQSFTSLKVLNLSGEEGGLRRNFRPLMAVIKSAPDLEELYLSNWNLSGIQDVSDNMDGNSLDVSTMPSLRILCLRDMEMGFPILPVSIQQITISRCENYSFAPGSDPVLPTFSSLRVFRLKSNSASYLDWAAALLRSSDGSIECLELDIIDMGVFMVDRYVIDAARAGRLRELKELYLPQTMTIDDDFIGELVRVAAQQLEVVDLSSTLITGAGIKKLVLAAKNLRKLILKNCQNVGIDAVEWARTRGIHVNFSFPENKKRKYANRIRITG